MTEIEIQEIFPIKNNLDMHNGAISLILYGRM